MPSPKPCPEGKHFNEKTRRCNKNKSSTSPAKKSSPDARAIADVAIMKQIQNDYMSVRSELAKMEKERNKYRDAYENMVRTMAKCHEDLKQEKRHR